MTTAFYVVLTYAAAALLLSWFYFRRYAMNRPPIGVFTLGDAAVVIGGVILVPSVYLLLPRVCVAVLLGLGGVSLLYFLGEPVLPRRGALWLVVIMIAAADVGAMQRFGGHSPAFLVVNNGVQTLTVVSVANLWAQSGMKARDIAALGGALSLYDVIATAQMPWMNELFHHVAGLPFAPVVGWGINGPRGLSCGAGDLLMAAVFAPVMRKAFGSGAGVMALTLGLGAFAVMLALLDRGTVRTAIPAMAVLGPLMVVQYAFWVARSGRERTTWEYLRTEPLRPGRVATWPPDPPKQAG